MRLSDPYWLILLVVAAFPWVGEWLRRRARWPSLGFFPPRGWRAGGSAWRSLLPPLFRSAALACLAVALARPQTVAGRTRIDTEGVAIVLLLDHSSSMAAEDFPTEAVEEPISRLEAAKRTIDRFIQGRPDDLIGLVTFANHPDLTCPPTLDHDVLRGLLAEVELTRPDLDGTNIGDAIAWGLRAVLETEPRQKVLILLTDGENNPERSTLGHKPLDPQFAAELVRRLGARMHAIGVGREGGTIRLGVPETGLSYQAGRVEGPDLEALERWADATGGAAFAATDASALEDVFDRIDELETTPFSGEILTRYREEFPPWAAAALGLLLLDRLLARHCRPLP